MHGGELHRGWRPGRGFVASMSEPTTSPQPAADTSVGTTATTPSRDAWAQAHAAMTSDYEGRRATHDTEVARFQRSQGRRSDWQRVQREQNLATGSLGLKGWWDRPEYKGTPSYSHNWLQMTPRTIHAGVGPMGGPDRIANLVERNTSQRALANRGAALESDGMVLGMLSPGDHGGDETPDPETTAPSVLSGGPASSFPRGGALPKGSQWSGVRFEPMT